jgi:hypothetical protein
MATHDVLVLRQSTVVGRREASMRRAGRLFVFAAVVMFAAAVLWRVRGQGAFSAVDQPEGAPLVPPASAPPSTAVAPGPSEARDDGDETRTMARIRDALRPDPTEALALIDAADREHPRGSFAEERAALRVDALVTQGRIGIARDAAEEFLRRYPDSKRAQHIEMLTGVHPRPFDPDDRVR